LVWISGPNGAGKTSILEALYLLDRGRTFRGRLGGPVTTRGEGATTIRGRVVDDHGRRHERRWSSERSSDGQRTAQLTRLVGTATFNLVEGEPWLRRRFFDWSLFHVEQDARSVWADLDRLQRQRNAWLRAGGKGSPVWDTPYAQRLEAVWERRVRFMGRVAEVFRMRTAELFPGGRLDLRWQRQVDAGAAAAVLSQQLSADLARGFTFLSSSRGDVVFLKDGVAWRGSRGENKLAGMLLQLALQEVLRSTVGRRPTVLLDDPYAEVSAASLGPVLGAWLDLADQVIVTGLDDARTSDLGLAPAAWFHVERGQICDAA
jgi:DNA replication and repair protein RecF